MAKLTNADCVMTDKWISMGDKVNLSKKRKAFKNLHWWVENRNWRLLENRAAENGVAVLPMSRPVLLIK